MRTRISLALCFALTCALPAAAAAENPESPPAAVEEAPKAAPEATVEQLHAALLDCMQNADSLGYEGRFERIGPVLDDTFDISFMAQKSVGRHWKALDAERRSQLVDTFRRFTVANYAGRFDRYSGQVFETLGGEESTRGTRIVRTRLLEPEGEEVQLSYRLREVNGAWRIIDVYLNGTVSELALRRSEYSSLLDREGFDGLLAALDKRVEELASGEPATGES